jgi:hypothetical protein
MCAATVSASRPGVVDARQRGEDLRRHLLGQLHVLLELLHDRAGQHLDLALVGAAESSSTVISALKNSPSVDVAQRHALAALDQHLDGAVGQLEQLQDGGQRADLVHVAQAGLIHVRLLLGDEHDLLAGLHGVVERLDRAFPADEQRDHHVRIDDHVPERQHGGAGLGALRSLRTVHGCRRTATVG